MKPVIQIENLSKQYQIGHAQQHHDTLRDALVDGVQGLLRVGQKRNTEDDTIWALKEVSFEVQPGEVLGVVGRNGAGKSTLLKILSRITEPTSGRAVINGRVGSLLEVGTGFHPELTGRENVFLNGAILGMKRTEIQRKFDEIVAFSEIEKFLDTPVKRYSSGMYVRLAFAVAANLDPEVLLVDEVLAVGDAAFQKKCLGKMGDIAGEGRTILFISHNMIAIRNLCQKALLLENGECIELAEVNTVVEKYLSHTTKEAFLNEVIWEKLEEAPGDENIRISRINIHSEEDETNHIFFIETGFIIGVDLNCFTNIDDWSVHFMVMTYDEIIAFTTSSRLEAILAELPLKPGKYRVNVNIPGNLLNEGTYYIQVKIFKGNHEIIFIEKAIKFEIIDSGAGRTSYFGKRKGIFSPTFSWKHEIIS